MRKFFIIINPASGRGEALKKLMIVNRRLYQAGIAFQVFYTQADRHADRVVEEEFNTNQFSDLMIIGGDGTINETLNGMKGSKVPVSLISAGRGNDAVRNLIGTLNLNLQIQIAIEGTSKSVDLGMCNNRVFVNGLGIGFDGKVVEIMNQSRGRTKGSFSYYRTVLGLLPKYKESSLQVKVDNQRLESIIFLMTVSKGKYFGGGFMLNPFASHTDGFLDLCLIRKISILKRFLFLPTMSFGGHKNLKEVTFLKSRECFVEADENMVAHLDGEFFGHPPFSIKVLPQYLNVRTG